MGGMARTAGEAARAKVRSAEMRRMVEMWSMGFVSGQLYLIKIEYGNRIWKRKLNDLLGDIVVVLFP